MPGLVNEGGQCQPTGPKRRHLLSLSRVATAVAWTLSAVRKQDFGSRIAGSSHLSTELGAGYTVHPELSGRPSAPLAQVTYCRDGSTGIAITPSSYSGQSWDRGSHTRSRPGVWQRHGRGTRAGAVSIRVSTGGGKRFMFQERVGFSLSLFVPVPRYGKTHCGGDECLARRCYATIPAACAPACVLRRSGPGREGGTLWKTVRTTQCTKHVDSK